MSDILINYTDLSRIGSIPNNPISPEEHQRLNFYIDLAKRGGPFTPEQVIDYRAIVAKLEAEKPQDSDVWQLVGLGALLLGLYMLGKKD